LYFHGLSPSPIFLIALVAFRERDWPLQLHWRFGEKQALMDYSIFVPACFVPLPLHLLFRPRRHSYFGLSGRLLLYHLAPPLRGFVYEQVSALAWPAL
jgi:hypothetical protein